MKNHCHFHEIPRGNRRIVENKHDWIEPKGKLPTYNFFDLLCYLERITRYIPWWNDGCDGHGWLV